MKSVGCLGGIDRSSGRSRELGDGTGKIGEAELVRR